MQSSTHLYTPTETPSAAAPNSCSTYSTPGGSARVYSGISGGHLYRAQLLDILQLGEEVEVRGLRTRELLNVVTEITDPLARCQIVPGRRANPWLALSEALWILAGRNDVAALAPYNKRIADFSDDGLTLYGAYGWRIAPQIEPLLARLRNDPADRRAVLSIWNERDLVKLTKDAPCNTQAMFKLRAGRLHMLVTCRSNDLHWGLHAVNLPTFSILQEYLAARLGVGVGTQTHVSQSLHVYLDGPALGVTARMLGAWDKSFVPMPACPLFERGEHLGATHEQFAEWCSAALDNDYDEDEDSPGFLVFAQKFLAAHDIPLEDQPFTKGFPQWHLMAEEYRR